ncbi:MAG TPA: hypothetical protein VEO19_16920 [Terriglobia bacterium]|nr:hypothetical protein [Terriglobia bacterium]
MGRNKNIRNRTAGLERAIAVHEKKIKNEEVKLSCNMERIDNSRGEIYEWKKQIEGLTQRLRRR